MNKFIVGGILCIETDAPEGIVRKVESEMLISGMTAYQLRRLGFTANELDRLWFSQSKKDIGGYWATHPNGGSVFIPSFAVKYGIEYTHNSIKKPTEDAVLVLDEIGDFYEA